MIFWLVILIINANVYGRDIIISNSANSLVTDAQVRFNLDTRSLVREGKMSPDGSSLLFFRKGIRIPYWIADSVHSCSTSIWLRMDSLPPGETKLHLLYSDSTYGYRNHFDSVFTKAEVEPGYGWVFHCDEGEGESSVSSDGYDSLILQEVTWTEEDGGGWGKREDQTFSSGSALHFEPGSFARWEMPAEACRDSFTIALWLRLDTLEYLSYSNSRVIVVERPDVFSLWLQRGTLGFTFEDVTPPRTCYLPPFGWERVGAPGIPPEFVPQGLTAMGEELLFSAYRSASPVSRVWRIDPKNLELLDWFDMPAEATHTSGLAYDSTRGILWASDYDSDKIYAIDPENSFAQDTAILIGKFKMHEDNVSACCLASFNDTMRLIVSTWESSGRTYVLDEQKSLDKGKAVILGSYKNIGYSQGLAFDGQYLWEAGLVLTQLNIDVAVEKGDYKEGLLSYFSEPPYPEDIAFLHDTLWMSNESWDKAFFRLADEPRKSLGRWMHLTVTYDGERLRIYCNGELANSAFTGEAKNDWRASPLFIGGSDGSKTSFQGLLDEVVILTRALNANETRDLFERRKPLEVEPSLYVEEEEDSLPNLGEVMDELSDPPGIEASSSKIVLVVPYERMIEVTLFDIAGRRVATLLPPESVKDRIELVWPRDINNGVYYMVVRSQGETFSRKVVLFR